MTDILGRVHIRHVPVTRPLPLVVRRIYSAVVDYWFRPGFYHQIGITRAFLFCAVLWTANEQIRNINANGGAAGYLASQNAESFYVFGIMKLVGGLPSVSLVEWAVWIAPIATICAIVGFLTRPAMIIATLSALFLTCLREGWYPYWSHGYNLVFYAALPFMFGRAGASWSFDHLIWQFGKGWTFGAPVQVRWSSWPVIAALWGASLFYFGAFVAKLYHGGLIDWWFSDNMRFSLAVTWIGYTEYEVPWYIELIWSHALLYWVVGLVHVGMQFLPVTALFCIGKPALRLVEGVIYAFGIYALYVFMTVWNPIWFLVAAVFVDWDWLIRKAKERFGFRLLLLSDSRSRAPAHLIFRPGAAVNVTLVFLTAFFGYYVYVFTFQRGEKELNYPFSSLAMYGSVRAKPPYNEHRHYDFYRGAIRANLTTCSFKFSAWEEQFKGQFKGKFDERFREESVSRARRNCDAQRNYLFTHITSTYPEQWRVGTLTGTRSALEATWAHLNVKPQYYVPGIEELSLYKQIAHYPAYPSDVRPIVAHEGLRGVLTRDGQFRAAKGTYYRDQSSQDLVIDVETSGFSDPEIRMLYRVDVRERPEVQPVDVLPGHWVGMKFIIDESQWKKPGFSLIEIRERGEERTYLFYGPDNLS